MKKIIEAITLFIFLVALICCGAIDGKWIEPEHKGTWNDTQIEMDDSDVTVVLKDQLNHTNSLESSSEESETEEIVTEEGNFLIDDNIYSFFQRTEAWQQGVAWSGEWSTFEDDGKLFSDFGCGLCCMANVYDTLKISSNYQFLTVTDYVEDDNDWKGNGIKEQWYRP